MKITAVRLFEVRGEMTFPGEFWEERLIRPVDIYPEHKDQGPGWLAKIEFANASDLDDLMKADSPDFAAFIAAEREKYGK